jgi:hypothetical protein
MYCLSAPVKFSEIASHGVFTGHAGHLLQPSPKIISDPLPLAVLGSYSLEELNLFKKLL